MCAGILEQKLIELRRDTDQLAKTKLSEILSVLDSLSVAQKSEEDREININIKVI